MARTPRRKSCSGIYHIMIRGINKEKIFAKEKDCEKLYKTLSEYLSEDLEIYSYCIMPNHLHLMIRGELKQITGYMSQVEVAYAAYYNLSRARIGTVFQGRFKSECVEAESYFWNCLNYIHENPVKAKIVKPGEYYKYSSFKEYQIEKPQLIHRKAIKLKQKNPERFGKMFIPEDYIIIDIPEEESIQRESYFYNKLSEFAETTGEDLETIANTSKLRNQFVSEEFEKGVLKKVTMENLFLKLRKE